MKKLVALLAFALAVPVLAQVTNPAPSVRLCQVASPVSHTGDTNDTLALSCQIPANSLGNTSRIELKALFLAGTNTGNCTNTIRFGANNSTADTLWLQDTALSSGSRDAMYGTVAEAGSANSQTLYGYGAKGASVVPNLAVLGLSVSTTAPIYVTFWIKPGVAADTCYMYEADLVVWP